MMVVVCGHDGGAGGQHEPGRDDAADVAAGRGDEESAAGGHDSDGWHHTPGSDRLAVGGNVVVAVVGNVVGAVVGGGRHGLPQDSWADEHLLQEKPNF